MEWYSSERGGKWTKHTFINKENWRKDNHLYAFEWADFNGDDGGRTGQDEPSLLMRWNGNGREK